MPGSRGTLAGRRHRSGRPYQRWKKAIREMWGDTCHLCGHAGARTADHLTPLSEWPDQPLDPKLSRPAHGTGNECPTCGQRCNQKRGTAPIEEDTDDYEPPLAW